MANLLTSRPATTLDWSRRALLATLSVLTIATWGVAIYQARTMDMAMGIAARSAGPMDDMGSMAMTGMAASGWSLGGAWTFTWAWAVMMAAMMFPAVAPMLLLFDRVSTQRTARKEGFISTWIFAAGYLLIWSGIGVIVYAFVQLGSDLATRLNPVDRSTWAPIALGATLIAAGLYQLTPLKRVCLEHCRTPLGYLMDNWHDGRLGALKMGFHHGLFCLGCCWALFAVMVAAGVMSLGWMILLTLIVFVEKVFPMGRRLATATGIGMLLLGALVATNAAEMPWVA